MFQDALSSYGIRSSMSRKGDCWDNAPTESLWGSLKVGRLYGRRSATQREAMDEVIDWLTFYNHRRLHSTLGYISPMKFEENWHAGQVKKAALKSGYALRLAGARPPLHLPSLFGDKDMIQKLMAYSGGLTGRITTLLAQAAELAIRKKTECISLDMLDQAASAGIFRIPVEEAADDAMA